MKDEVEVSKKIKRNHSWVPKPGAQSTFMCVNCYTVKRQLQQAGSKDDKQMVTIRLYSRGGPEVRDEPECE